MTDNTTVRSRVWDRYLSLLQNVPKSSKSEPVSYSIGKRICWIESDVTWTWPLTSIQCRG